MGFVDKLKYRLSAVHLKHVCKRLSYFYRYEVIKRKRIRLAVLGTTSSGKSFLLKDIISSLQNMCANFHDLETALQPYSNIYSYKPDQKGGNGGTPLYACRQDDHYGATVKHNNPNNDEYDIDFLNIPGEIFEVPKDGSISRLYAYNVLRDQLKKAGRVFVVKLWMREDTEEEVWIVEYVHGATSDTQSANDDTLMSFKNWTKLFKDLNDYRFKPVKGSERKISGAYLLKHFFEYDTDSAIDSIGEWIKANGKDKLGFDKTDFSTTGIDRSFVFFQYCSLATDIVVCDRIFANAKDNLTQMPFEDLVNGLNAFIKDSSESDSLHVYLAFRNVDFIMDAHEDTYKMLNERTLAEMPDMERHNAIYSLFAYAMQHYLDPTLNVQKRIAAFLGIPEDKFQSDGTQAVTPDGITTDVDLLLQALVDPKGGSGYLTVVPGLKEHISSRLGSLKLGFKGLLNKTQFKPMDETKPTGRIVPHVYFSCTPITSEYDIYHNYVDEKNGTSSDFKKTKNGDDYYFKDLEANKLCFGTFQLTMDILAQHQLGNIKVGGLLRIMQNKV